MGYEQGKKPTRRKIENTPANLICSRPFQGSRNHLEVFEADPLEMRPRFPPSPRWMTIVRTQGIRAKTVASARRELGWYWTTGKVGPQTNGG